MSALPHCICSRFELQNVPIKSKTENSRLFYKVHGNIWPTSNFICLFFCEWCVTLTLLIVDGNDWNVPECNAMKFFGKLYYFICFAQTQCVYSKLMPREMWIVHDLWKNMTQQCIQLLLLRTSLENYDYCNRGGNQFSDRLVLVSVAKMPKKLPHLPCPFGFSCPKIYVFIRFLNRIRSQVESCGPIHFPLVALCIVRKS